MYKSGLIGSDITRVDNHMKIVVGQVGSVRQSRKERPWGMWKHTKRPPNTEEMRRKEKR
jgi:hypothetical protein